MNQPKSQPNFQNVVLAELKSKRLQATIFLMNGFQLKGTVLAYDNFVLIIEDGNKLQQMIFKHAISTIIPSRPVLLNRPE